MTQGPWGRAKKSRQLQVADLQNPDPADYPLDEEQRRKMQGLTLVFSMPIRKPELKADKRWHLTGPVIGVVNLDSKKTLAYYRGTTIPGTTKTLEAEVGDTLRSASQVCSWFMG